VNHPPPRPSPPKPPSPMSCGHTVLSGASPRELIRSLPKAARFGVDSNVMVSHGRTRKTENLDADLGKAIADQLRERKVRGILISAAELGYITELACQMPECLCPEELGGRSYFESVADLPDWMPTRDHYPILKKDGGLLTVDNVRLAHRLCNRVDYAKNHGRSYAKDLQRVQAARLEVITRTEETKSGKPKTTVHAQLIRADAETVVIFIKDAPIEVTRRRQPRTFDKLAALIDKNPERVS
jgi:hypothetical protein